MTGARTSSHEESLATALWLLVAQAGHHRCAGWTFEERDRLLRCACGAPLYELRTLDQDQDQDQEQDPDDDPASGSRSGPVARETVDDAG